MPTSDSGCEESSLTNRDLITVICAYYGETYQRITAIALPGSKSPAQHTGEEVQLEVARRMPAEVGSPVHVYWYAGPEPPHIAHLYHHGGGAGAAWERSLVGWSLEATPPRTIVS